MYVMGIKLHFSKCWGLLRVLFWAYFRDFRYFRYFRCCHLFRLFTLIHPYFDLYTTPSSCQHRRALTSDPKNDVISSIFLQKKNAHHSQKVCTHLTFCTLTYFCLYTLQYNNFPLKLNCTTSRSCSPSPHLSVRYPSHIHLFSKFSRLFRLYFSFFRVLTC